MDIKKLVTIELKLTKKGGQVNHKGTTLTKKIETMIANNEIDEIIVVEENKNNDNKDLTPAVRYEYDIEIKRKVIKHLIYPSKKQNIKKLHVIYGNNIKVYNRILGQKYMSLDGKFLF